jgi:hypothetical protein
MAANVLKSQLSFVAVAPGAVAVLAHGLSVDNVAQQPDAIAIENQDFDYVSSTTTTVTVINNGAAAASCRILCEVWHTFERVFGGNATTSLTGKPFVSRGSAALTPPIASGEFATFDPRIDGLAAPTGSVWRATDCPMVMRKVADADTDWVIDRGPRPAILAVLTDAEMNALCRGFARQPALDFTPDHILTPDLANNRFTDSVAGAHLIRYGVSATIDESPFYDSQSRFGHQAEQTDEVASFYAAVDPTVYDVSVEAFSVMFISAFAKDGGGGLYISKIKYPAPGQDRGWGVSVNSDNGFGFLIRGNITELNNDTATYSANVVDGRTRVFFHGRSITGSIGYTLTPEFAEVSVAGLAGDIANTDGIFGLVNDGFGLPLAANSTSQTTKIAFWRGAAAENLATYRAIIARGFQDMFDEASNELQSFVQQYPIPTTNAEFSVRTGLTGAFYRPDWVNAAGNVVSQGGVAATLVATGATTQYQKLVSGLVGMGFPAATLDACSANVLPVGNDSLIGGGRFGHVSNAGALNAHILIGRIVGGATAHGWAIWVQDDGDLVYYFSDGVLSFSAVFAAGVLTLNERPIDIVVQLDRSGADPTARLLWARDGVVLGTLTVVMAGLGNLTTAGQEFGHGAIPAGAPAFNGGASVHFSFCAIGVQATTASQRDRVARGVGFVKFEAMAAQSLIG